MKRPSPVDVMIPLVIFSILFVLYLNARDSYSDMLLGKHMYCYLGDDLVEGTVEHIKGDDLVIKESDNVYIIFTKDQCYTREEWRDEQIEKRN